MLSLRVQGNRPRSGKQRRLLLLCVLRKHIRGTQSDRSKRRNIAGAGQHKSFSLAPRGYPLIWAVKKKVEREWRSHGVSLLGESDPRRLWYEAVVLACERSRDVLPKSLPKFCDFQSFFALNSFRYSSSRNWASSSEISPLVRADAMLFPQIRFSNFVLFTYFLPNQIRFCNISF